MKKTTVTQQAFLRGAIKSLRLTRRQFASRFCIPKRRLDNWLLPSGSSGLRPIDPSVRQYVEEVLRLRAQKRQLVRVIKNMRNHAKDNPNDIKAETLVTFAEEIKLHLKDPI